MKRRNFLASASALAGVLVSVQTANAVQMPANLNTPEVDRIETAIKGSFGAGFSLVSAKRSNGSNGGVTATIEHNENYMEVASIDLVEWEILRATEM